MQRIIRATRYPEASSPSPIFGVFIGLEGSIDGLIHLSDLSWDDAGEDVVRQYKKGEEIEAVVLAVDPERERVSLGIKQATQDPFSSYVHEHGKGSVVKRYHR